MFGHSKKVAEATTSNELKKILPLLARHEGVWEGTYRHYNLDGVLTDAHASRLICRFPEDGHPYHQTNHYRWDDGKREVRDFPATVKDGRLFWDNEFINGWACDVALDDFNRTTMLNWTRTGEPDLYLYEMIQLSDDGQARARVWQWYKADRLFQRTLVDEHFVTKDWRSYEGKEF
ncbi:MAG: DUF3598 domain-containing protein [Pseudomonadota bacterium]